MVYICSMLALISFTLLTSLRRGVGTGSFNPFRPWSLESKIGFGRNSVRISILVYHTWLIPTLRYWQWSLQTLQSTNIPSHTLPKVKPIAPREDAPNVKDTLMIMRSGDGRGDRERREQFFICIHIVVMCIITVNKIGSLLRRLFFVMLPGTLGACQKYESETKWKIAACSYHRTICVSSTSSVFPLWVSEI